MEKIPIHKNTENTSEFREVEGSDIGYGPTLRKDVETPNNDPRQMIEVGRNEAGYPEYEFRELSPEEENDRQLGIRKVLAEIGVIDDDQENVKKKIS